MLDVLQYLAAKPWNVCTLCDYTSKLDKIESAQL